MSIYTKTGDAGTTSLASGVRVPKDDLRLEAYGTADELNSFIGLLRAKTEIGTDYLDWIQNRLFNLGAALSDAPGDWIVEEDAHQLEQWIDVMQQDLPPLRAFILPGGSEAISLCHICRTITRRLERHLVAMNASPDYLIFVNRLSDFFFILSRETAKMEKIEHIMWKK